MMQNTAKDAEGTLSYVTATGSLFLKVSQGWKEIQVLTQMNTLRSTSHIISMMLDSYFHLSLLSPLFFKQSDILRSALNTILRPHRCTLMSEELLETSHRAASF